VVKFKTKDFQMSKTYALYFPYHPANGEWLRHALLYYDFIGTTVPSAFEQDLDNCKLPDYAVELRDLGQYISLTDQLGYRPLLDELASKNSAFDFARIPGAEDFGLMMFMDPQMSAHDSLRKENFLLVDLLAEAIAGLSNDLVVPGTDSYKSFRHLYEDVSQEGTIAPLKGVHLTYRQLLPSPAPDVPLSKIVKFKEKRREELLQLRIALGTYRDTINSSSSVDELKIQLADHQAKVELGLKDLQKVLRADGLGTLLGVVKELVSLNPPTLASLIAIGTSTGLIATTAKDLTNTPLSALLTGVAISGSILISTAVANFRRSKNQKLQGSPYAYLHFAQQEKLLMMPNSNDRTKK
jgi:hypothetical protein